MPASAAILTDSVSRSSASAPSATYSAVAGVVGLAGAAALLLSRLGRAFGRRMVGPFVGGRRRAPAFQAASAHAAGPDRRPLLGAGFADRTPAP
jgi:hypothetical protein